MPLEPTLEVFEDEEYSSSSSVENGEFSSEEKYVEDEKDKEFYECVRMRTSTIVSSVQEYRQCLEEYQKRKTLQDMARGLQDPREREDKELQEKSRNFLERISTFFE